MKTHHRRRSKDWRSLCRPGRPTEGTTTITRISYRLADAVAQARHGSRSRKSVKEGEKERYVKQRLPDLFSRSSPPLSRLGQSNLTLG